MAAVTLTELNDVQRDWASMIIVPEHAEWADNPVLKVLKTRIDRTAFRGNRIEIKMKTAMGGIAQGFTDNVAIPVGEAPDWVTQYIDLKWIIANAQLTHQATQRAVKGDNSWINSMDDALSDMMLRFNHLQEVSANGNGTGFVAEVSAASDDSATPNIVTVSCDQAYTDNGFENVQALLPGDYVDIYQSNGTTIRVTKAKVITVTEGLRTANGSYAAATGTFTVAVALGHGIVNGDLVCMNGSLNRLPMGLGGMVQDGTHYTATYGRVSTFQNLARSGRAGLQSYMLQATDFGIATESPADGVPTLWGLSVVSDAITVVQRRSGLKVTDLFMHGDTATAIDTLNQSEKGITVNVANTAGTFQTAAGKRYARQFIAPDGHLIDIHACDTMPRHVIRGVAADAIHWSPAEEFNFLRMYGDVWGPTKGDSYVAYEAPFTGAYQMWCERCDGFFEISDLRVDV